MQFIRRRQLTIHYYKWPIEIRRAIHFKLIGKCIPGKPIAIALQEQYVQAYLLAGRMRYLAIWLYCYLLAEYTEQWLLI